MAIDANKVAQLEARAAIAKALAHATRLYVLELLQQGERTVGELTQAVGSDQSTLSKHLVVLKNVGLIAMRQEGPAHYYRLTCDCIDDFFGCLEGMLLAELSQRQIAAGCCSGKKGKR